MKSILDKVLKLGLITKDTARQMELWGMLPPGSDSKVKEFIDNIPMRQFNKWVEELAEELEKEFEVRETNLDLARLRWPVLVDIVAGTIVAHNGITALIDSFGKYYFRIQDVEEHWFVPGYKIARHDVESMETIAEKQVLYTDEIPVCLLVTVLKEV